MEQATILVVDDDPDMRQLLDESLTALGYHVSTADSGETALDMVWRREPDLVLTDVHMARMGGLELCRALKADPRWQLIPVILLTAVGDLKARVAGLEAGADDFFTKPYELVELRTRVAALLRVKALVDQLERAESIITTLGLTIEARDPYTGGHCDRLAGYAVALGHALGVDQPTLRALRLAGFLHDVGKIAVPDAILLKPGPLDPPSARKCNATRARAPTSSRA
jgi:putative two-component system response regulator